MDIYPYKFEPIYKETIWGGRNLQRLFDRPLPPGKNIGESWDLADLPQGTTAVENGPLKGCGLDALTRELGGNLLGRATTADGRFPLLLKWLDANDILSLQVHPDAQAAGELAHAALKTECWYIMESRDGFIYRDLKAGVTVDQLPAAIQRDEMAALVNRCRVKAGDFFYLPAGMVHALGSGLVVAEVQTPSDTTYRVSDWGRGRSTHPRESLQCIRAGLPTDAPGAGGDRLVDTEFFRVDKRTAAAGRPVPLGEGRCVALMILSGRCDIVHDGAAEPTVACAAGQTVLLPASLRQARLVASSACLYLEVSLSEK